MGVTELGKPTDGADYAESLKGKSKSYDNAVWIKNIKVPL